MKTTARESYGFGPRLSTRKDRLSKVACILIATCILGLLGGALWT